jgi:hypothetical protein
MPAVLIETLNHSSPIDCAKLAKSEFRERLAFELAKAYADYLGHTLPRKEEKERRVIMQHGKKHFLTVLPQDNYLYISNTDNDTEIHVVRKFYNEHGKLTTNNVVVIPPHETWGIKLNSMYGLLTLTALGAFTSRLA